MKKEDMIAKDLLNNAYHKALGEVFKAKEGDKKMIFGKPFEMKGGKWVPSSGGGKKESIPAKEGSPLNAMGKNPEAKVLYVGKPKRKPATAEEAKERMGRTLGTPAGKKEAPKKDKPKSEGSSVETEAKKRYTDMKNEYRKLQRYAEEGQLSHSEKQRMRDLKQRMREEERRQY